jgi:hypothetical protein
MREDSKRRFEFSYENDVTASYLIITAGSRDKVWDYQVKMIKSNRIKGILPFNAEIKNDKVSFYYNVTSKLTLRQFLKIKILKRNEFISLLLDIVKILQDCKNYLLNDKCFLLDENYIYIDPATLEISMAYIPVEADEDINLNFREFITGLIMNSANIDDSAGDNFLQKIFAGLKSHTFNASGFGRLLKELLEISHIDEYSLPANVNMDNGFQGCGRDSKKAGSKPDEVKEGSNETGLKFMPILIVGLCQLVIVVFIVTANKFLKLPGNNSTAVYAGMGLIALAADVLILKRLFGKRGQAVGMVCEDASLPAEAGADMPSMILEEPMPGKETTGHFGVQDILNGGSSETVFLGPPGSVTENCPCLVSEKEGIPEKILILKPEFVIGRLEGQVDHAVENKAIGKVHAQIISRDGSYYIMDLNSRNGTFVNGVRIDSNKEYEIRDNDGISLANSDYTFVVPKQDTC